VKLPGSRYEFQDWVSRSLNCSAVPVSWKGEPWVKLAEKKNLQVLKTRGVGEGEVVSEGVAEGLTERVGVTLGDLEMVGEALGERDLLGVAVGVGVRELVGV
jgi:hypothetical protein